MSKRRIQVPATVLDVGKFVVASVSGGKDSTALLLALKEVEVPFKAVFADTGWEAHETIDYVAMLSQRVAPIDVVRAEKQMLDWVEHYASFPARMQRWCTRKLKVEPLRAYHDVLERDLDVETVNAVGIRAEESQARAKMAVFDDDEEWGGYMWRPLLDWSVEDVIEIHKRHGVPMNPLYHRGFDRVGCYPCIFSRKGEIRLLAETDPGRIDLIERLEQQVTQQRKDRNVEKPGRHSDAEATFFRTKAGASPIRTVVAWSRTDRRGLPLLEALPEGGCMRWGLCESPTNGGDEEEACR